MNRTELSKLLVERVLNDGLNVKDYLVSQKQLITKTDENVNVKIGIRNEDDYSFDLHPNSITQISQKLNIPSKYLSSLAEGTKWEKELFATTLNEHFTNLAQSKPVLLRANENTLKGYLSNSFERYNSTSVLKQFLESFMLNGMIFHEAYYDGITYFIELRNDNNVIMLNNTPHFFGVQYRNSDFGRSALDIKLILIKQICSNGMLMKSALRQVHRSRAIEIGDSFLLSPETMEKETEAKVSLIKDIANYACSDEMISEIVNVYNKVNELDVSSENVFKTLENLGATKKDVDYITKLLIENKPETGVSDGNTIIKVANAVSYMANNELLEKAEVINRYKEMSGNLINYYGN